KKGVVLHNASGRQLRYGELVEKAAALPVPKQVVLKDPKSFKLLGQPLRRVDLAEKVNGSAVFGMDVRLPNMLVARVLRCPVFKGKVATFDFDLNKAGAVPGVRHVVLVGSSAAGLTVGFIATKNAASSGIDVDADY